MIDVSRVLMGAGNSTLRLEVTNHACGTRAKMSFDFWLVCVDIPSVFLSLSVLKIETCNWNWTSLRLGQSWSWTFCWPSCQPSWMAAITKNHKNSCMTTYNIEREYSWWVTEVKFFTPLVILLNDIGRPKCFAKFWQKRVDTPSNGRAPLHMGNTRSISEQ